MKKGKAGREARASEVLMCEAGGGTGLRRLGSAIARERERALALGAWCFPRVMSLRCAFDVVTSLLFVALLFPCSSSD